MKGSEAAHRLLLVEDDASLQRFVRMALDGFEPALEIVTVASVDEALLELSRGRFALIITDLMLPGRGGGELIDALDSRPALHGVARVVVFSAGLTTEVRRRLERPGVWRLLSKPCSLSELENCVREGLAAEPTVAAPTGEDGEAVREYFGGDAILFNTFRTDCQRQFLADARAGDAALAAADLEALQRLVHGLKTVLLTLGRVDASSLAARLEAACAAGQTDVACVLWPALHAELTA